MTDHSPSAETIQNLKFEILNPTQLFGKLDRHDVGGLYSIGLANVHESLVRIGYLKETPEVWTGSHFHVYVGETYSLKARMRQHFGLDDEKSNFRSTLALVLGMDDERTKRYLIENAIVGWCYVDYMGDVERDLIKKTACPLNVRGKGPSPFATRLRQLRRASHG